MKFTPNINYGHNSKRLIFKKLKKTLAMPNLIDIQLKPYKWFIDAGIEEIFNKIFPIVRRDGNVALSMKKWWIEESPISYRQAKEDSTNYAHRIYGIIDLDAQQNGSMIPFEEGEPINHELLLKTKIETSLEARVILVNKIKQTYYFESGKKGQSNYVAIEATVEDEKPDCLVANFVISRPNRRVYFGKFPTMTDKGTFIVNGSEKVIISQLIRSPGVYYKSVFNNKVGVNNDSLIIIPYQGTWLEAEKEYKKTLYSNHEKKPVIFLKIDKNRKVTLTSFLTALGLTMEAVEEIFDHNEVLKNTYELDELTGDFKIDRSHAVQDIYKKIRSGEIATDQGAFDYLYNMLFDERKYLLTGAGRFKIQRKLVLFNQIHHTTLAQDVVDNNKKVVMKKGTYLNSANCEELRKYLKAGYCDYIIDYKHKKENKENVVQRLQVYPETYDNEKVAVTLIGVPEGKTYLHLSIADIIASFGYLLNLHKEVGKTDGIDHLGNKRVRTVGELLYNLFNVGALRVSQNIKEKMSFAQNNFIMDPTKLFNNKPLEYYVDEFFNLSQLCQFMDQTNPLSELSNKRRLSALGPGGLSRKRTGLEARDVHSSHYGRICPIETPEGPNIGLINNLAAYAKVNHYGFIETPYRKVEKSYLKDEYRYFFADDEQPFVIAQADIEINNENKIVDSEVVARKHEDNLIVKPSEIEWIDISPQQMLSVASSCIPFIEHNDANRALMGANMSRQAVPLIKHESPVVGTGMEHMIARDSGSAVIAQEAGTVVYVDGMRVIIKNKANKERHYHLDNFVRSNQGTVINHNPLVKKGDKVVAKQIIADGPSMEKGELALGKNLVVAFTPWKGYNFEDAIILSERVRIDDVLTSMHINCYKIERRKTKLGDEEITNEIPNVSENALRNLDEEGIILVGTEVKAGDILVGKITPKEQAYLSAEDKLLNAIFGDKSKNVKDNSLRVPNGADGIVQRIKRFNSKDHDLPADILEIIKVFIVEKRKIQVGDKLAGRHGNKGVVSIILPIQDMPYLEDGTPVDIMLNPLGVPSRMNLGQVLETHLGMAAKNLNLKVAVPAFQSLSNEQLLEIMKKAGMAKDGKQWLIDGRSGERMNEPVSIGVIYMMKLSHMVDDKIHARNIGPYSLITQQPLGGKAQNGGQRFGEMEVWALEAYGATYLLQEMLTIKSDDIWGRYQVYDAILNNRPFPKPQIPESFNLLMREIRGLGFDINLLDEQNKEVYQDITYESSELYKKSELKFEHNLAQKSSLDQSDQTEAKVDYLDSDLETMFENELVNNIAEEIDDISSSSSSEAEPDPAVNVNNQEEEENND